MPLIQSISGIRGTLGGTFHDTINPVNIAQFTAAYAMWLLKKSGKKRIKVVVGRDARPSGGFISTIVKGTLTGCGLDVIDLGMCPTPTVEIATTMEHCDGGIIITASHNPVEWNALKLLNGHGEFLSADDGKTILETVSGNRFNFPGNGHYGLEKQDNSCISKHVKKILSHELFAKRAVVRKKFRVVIDCINSVGSLAVPLLLRDAGVHDVILINEAPDGNFAHNPEPLPENLQELSETVRKKKAHVGFAVDPDVDRLAIVCEDGSMFGEEYTLVAVAGYVLSHRPGNTVSNLSSTRALKDVTEKHGGNYYASAVGEVNVVEMMKKCKAVIGGEGNGGVIVPDLHYGRDALAGIALFLSHLATSGLSCCELRRTYPDYYMSKNKLTLPSNVRMEDIVPVLEKKYRHQPINNEDGIKIEFARGWVHLRKSNTEPIIRIYSEGKTITVADDLAGMVMQDIKNLC